MAPALPARSIPAPLAADVVLGGAVDDELELLAVDDELDVVLALVALAAVWNASNVFAPVIGAFTAKTIPCSQCLRSHKRVLDKVLCEGLYQSTYPGCRQ